MKAPERAPILKQKRGYEIMARKNSKATSTKVQGKTLVVATERGFLSDEGRGVAAGEQFYVSDTMANTGALWFKVVGAEAEAEAEPEVKTEDLEIA